MPLIKEKPQYLEFFNCIIIKGRFKVNKYKTNYIRRSFLKVGIEFVI